MVSSDFAKNKRAKIVFSDCLPDFPAGSGLPRDLSLSSDNPAHGPRSMKTGLTVKASLDTNEYKGGIKILDKEMKTINIDRHEFHGNDWNYTILP